MNEFWDVKFHYVCMCCVSVDECDGWGDSICFITLKEEWKGNVLDEPFLLKIQKFPIILMQSHNMLRSSSISSSLHLLTYLQNSISNHALPHTHFHTIHTVFVWGLKSLFYIHMCVRDCSAYVYRWKCTIKMKNLCQSM